MKDKALGQKIRNYREAAGMSQLELELEIGASPGSLSRIESGKVNPTKETIIMISQKLNLNSFQVAQLFDIRVLGDLLSSKHENEAGIQYLIREYLFDNVIQYLLTEFQVKLGFLGCSLAVVDLDKEFLSVKYFSLNKIKDYLLKLIPEEMVYSKVRLDRSFDRTETLEVVQRKEVSIGGKLSDYISPPVPVSVASTLQTVFKIKSVLAVPLISKEKEVLGVVNIVDTKVITGEEIRVIKSIVPIFAVIIELINKL